MDPANAFPEPLPFPVFQDRLSAERCNRLPGAARSGGGVREGLPPSRLQNRVSQALYLCGEHGKPEILLKSPFHDTF